MRGLVGCRGFMKGACPETDVTGVRKGKRHKFYPSCPFKNSKTNIYIPTIGELKKGIENLQKFDKEKALKVQELIFKKWAEWE